MNQLNFRIIRSKLSKLEIPNYPVELPKVAGSKSFILLRFAGYIILAFSLIDYADILFPLQLTNTSWEFQTIGQLVEHIWAPLLGLTFVFIHQQHEYISRFELLLLKALSWLSLIVGVLYLLMLPLEINNSMTIYSNTNKQITYQAQQQKEQLSELGQQVERANTLAELHNLDKFINHQNSTQSNDSPQELKDKLSQQVQAVAQNITKTAEKTKRSTNRSLIKAAVKVNLGIILSGGCLITIWNLTRWLRRLE